MVSEDKEFEYVTSQIVKHVERTVDAFKLFAQLFSAIVGGAIWLSTQRVSPEAAKTYSHLSVGLVILVTVIVSIMILENYRAWRGFRAAQSRLVPHVPPPKRRSEKTGWVMILCMVAGCALFWWFNPFNSVARANASIPNLTDKTSASSPR
jgi:hypothetical protein